MFFTFFTSALAAIRKLSENHGTLVIELIIAPFVNLSIFKIMVIIIAMASCLDRVQEEG